MKQTSNKTVEATRGIVLRIWWWIAWRAFISAFAGGFIVGFIVGLTSGIMGIHSPTIQTIPTLIGGMIGIILNIFFTKEAIGRKFKDVNLVLIKTDKSE
jgi:flagellar biosynthesis protein FliQ